eukprot:260117-Rhodomonas_salina.1
MSGTDIRYAPTGARAYRVPRSHVPRKIRCDGMRGSDLGYGATGCVVLTSRILLRGVWMRGTDVRMCYGMRGTDVAYVLRDAWY